MMIDTTAVAKSYLAELKKTLTKVKPKDIQKIAEVLLEAYKNDRTVFILGNGGAASTASHMACDLGKGTLKNVYNLEEKRLKAVSLTDNVSTMTAFANDLSFDDIFVQQLHNLIKKQDVVIGISGSGNSPNIIKALMYAKSQGAVTIGFLGFYNGGKAKEFADLAITIQSNNYGINEDIHMTLNHVLTSCLSYMKQHMDNEIASPDSLDKKIKKTPRPNVIHEWIERSARR